jgi:aryl-alcohol dehydrogenase (NADP+)
LLSGKYRRDAPVTDSARSDYTGPTEADYPIIETVAEVAAELATTPAAVALAWLLARPGTVVPIIGARRIGHLTDNLAGLETRLRPEHLDRLTQVSAPTLNYPAPMHGPQRAMLQFAGTAVDGENSGVYPPPLTSAVRY